MNIKELLEKEKLIIPEIQRDYVWGNNELVIKRFISNIKNMKDNEELDIGFFYSYKIYDNDKNYNALIDGQQRITTLILLSWYVGVDNVKLNNFQFKVRENSNNFLEELLNQESDKIFEIDGKNFSDKIKNCIWYKRIWDNDPTVKSILNAIDIIDSELKDKKENIKKKIDNIKFSCINPNINNSDLKENRILEKEYILLNSRGVKLTNSEQLKAILTEDIENKNEWLEKWEKDWQDILWECKGNDIYNIDNIWNAVLYWVRDIYVIENNICKDNDKEKINYDFDLIGIEKENKEKILKILDWIIPVLKIINDNLETIQEKCQFENKNKPIINIREKIRGNEKYSLTIQEKALFYSILYLIKNFKDKNIQLDIIIKFILKNHHIHIGERTAEEIKISMADYKTMDIRGIDSFDEMLKTVTINIAEVSDKILEIVEVEKVRIFRNLIENSNINASNLHNAVTSLKDFNLDILGELEGLNKEQQEEEDLKLEIFEKYKEYKDIIIEIENSDLFKGKIKNLFLLFLCDEELEKNYNSKDFYKNKRDILLKLLENNQIKFQNLFCIYKELNSNKNSILGELLLEEDVYKSDKKDIWLKYYNEEYIFLKLVDLYITKVDKNISYKTINFEEFLNRNRKENIRNKLHIKNSEDFLEIKEPKHQLYILYVVGYDNGYFIFTKINNNKNFKICVGEYKNKKRLENSPFNRKLVFQSYRYVYRGGQPYVKTEEIIKEFDIQNFLEKYIK